MLACATPPDAAARPQVAVLGAAGGIGQPLSLLLKMNPLVSTLALYDIANTPGVAADLSHCNTPAQARCARRAAPRTQLPPARAMRASWRQSRPRLRAAAPPLANPASS